MPEPIFADEAERRAAALAVMRGAEPPQGSTGGAAHDIARPDREALELYAEANELPIIDGVLNPRILAAARADVDEMSRSPGEFGGH